jgi:F1F0 ATPase subunit 2
MSAAPLTIAMVVIASFAAGGALGWLFYAGLYLTVRALARARRPALLIGASLLVRMLVLLAGLLGLMLAGEAWTGDGWLALLPALLGIVVARSLLLRGPGQSRSRPGVRASTGPGSDRHAGGAAGTDNRRTGSALR